MLKHVSYEKNDIYAFATCIMYKHLLINITISLTSTCNIQHKDFFLIIMVILVSTIELEIANLFYFHISQLDSIDNITSRFVIYMPMTF